MSVNSLLSQKSEVYFLHYDCMGESVYLKVHSGKKQVTVVAITGKNGKSGRYCKGVYSLAWTTYMGTYGYYSKYWDKTNDPRITHTITGNRIAWFLKVTTENQYERAKAEVLNSLV